jgi:protein-disulfide isomerase
VTTKSSAASASAPLDGRAARALGLLAGLGALASLWALYLWSELVAARRGGTPFCAFGESDCAALWDAGFASAIHRATGLPVAAWGLVWGIVALALPVAALVVASGGRPVGRLAAAVRATAIAGAAGVVALLAASAAAGMFCSSCALTYVVTLAYAAIGIVVLKGVAAGLFAKGAVTAAAVTAVAFLTLLYPGLKTPRDAVRAGDEALRAVAPSAPAAAVAGRALPDATSKLNELIAGLRPEARQALADSLYLYANSPAVAQETPRALAGPADAPVRITTFTDVLCSHCASLHATLDYLTTILPAESFAVDSRQFPLDGACNRHLQGGGAESVRCLASKARLCFDPTPRGKEFAGALYARQSDLTPELVYEIAAPYAARADLERCVASGATARSLAEDVDYAWRFRPDGTPLVLVNGRQGTSFGPFLYAMVLTGGDPSHPAFAALPPANPNAHIH